MISEFFLMNGYGFYVWSAFIFTFFSFFLLYVIIKVQFLAEKKKFISKYGALTPERASFAKAQSINKEILSNTSSF
tara:strand:+ start:794 stop:1021 length:228 start_codon:yes stop_codon:yes gene_type:complete